MRGIALIALFCAATRLAVAGDEESCSAATGEQQCSSIPPSADINNKYTKAHSTFVDRLTAALESYEPCNATNTCDCYTGQIEADLRPFASGIDRQQIEAVASRGTRYQIVGHRLYRQRDCMFPSRCSGIEHFVRASLAQLPDLELIINCRDWPQIRPAWSAGRIDGPVLSFSKTADYADILYPAWSFWEGGPAISLYPTGLGRWDEQRRRIAAARERWPWPEKRPVAFFRGSRTSDERDALVRLSRTAPDLVDARYTRNQAWKSSADTLGAEPAAEVLLEDHCAYRFLFNFRGVAASFRFKHLFVCGSLVFHVGDEWQEFFYGQLRPWVHYVPVRADADERELRALVEFFREHDDLAQEIALRGFVHVWQHLDEDLAPCYWRRLLRRYAKLQRFEVVRNEDLIEIV